MARISLAALLLIGLLTFSFEAGCSGKRVGGKSEPRTAKKPAGAVTAVNTEDWRVEGVRIAGKYTDADVVELEDGRFRIYYTVEPEVPGNKKEMYSAVSSDGLSWQQEAGVRMKHHNFPDVIRLADGRWRMYCQGFRAGPGSEPETAIVSAISADGLSWGEEEGVRIRKGLQGTYDLRNVAAPSTVRLEDGSYLMVYRGGAGENSFGLRDPVDNKLKPVDYLISATSHDGVSWQADRVLVDSNNEILRGLVDGPELVYDAKILKLYYWSFSGIYVQESRDAGKTWSQAKLIIKSTGPDYAPGDPTVIKEGGAWRLYFGLYTKGIFSARRSR